MGAGARRGVGDQDRAISIITVSELLHGVHRAQAGMVRARRSAFVEHVISAIESLPITTAIARAHAGIWAELEKDGNLIGAHNLWIVATALSHGMNIATANTRDFGRVPGLNVVPV